MRVSLCRALSLALVATFALASVAGARPLRAGSRPTAKQDSSVLERPAPDGPSAPASSPFGEESGQGSGGEESSADATPEQSGAEVGPAESSGEASAEVGSAIGSEATPSGADEGGEPGSPPAMSGADSASDDEEADPPQGEDEGSADAEEEESELSFTGSFGGQYRHRFVMMSDFPLEALPRSGDAREAPYGPNYWGEQWLRVHGELALRPILRLYGEADVVWGLAYGDLAVGTEPAAWSRQEYGYPGLRLRQLYLDWLTPIGLLRVGQMAFSWGLGMISNGGDEAPLFGDSRFGDLVRRVLFATKPAGRDSPFTIALAGDWVAWDLIADFEGRGDLAFQGVLAGMYEEGSNRAGAYVAYRDQTNVLEDYLRVFVADAFVDLRFDEPSGGQVLVAGELVYVRGTTTLSRTAEHPTQEVEQLMGIARLGRVARDVDVIVEGGYASGDSNSLDAFQRRATMDSDRRVGLILFPEVLAAQTARSAFLARSPELFGRPARGAELLPTNGGVAGAYYLNPYFVWRPLEWLETRFATLLAWATTDVVDPYGQRARSRATNYRGGDPSRRDLGLELDGSILLHGPIASGIVLSGGIEGGVLFPGRAFDDAAGEPMAPVGLLRARLGLAY